MSKTKTQLQNEANELGIGETVQSLLDLDQMQAAANLVETQQQNQKLAQENAKLKSDSSGLTPMQKLYRSFMLGEQEKNFSLVYDCFVNYKESNKAILQKHDSSQSNVPTAVKKSLIVLYYNDLLNKDSELYTTLDNELSAPNILPDNQPVATGQQHASNQ